MSNEETGSPALAQMTHQSDLFTWLVRTAGNALAILVLTPLLLGAVGAVLDPEDGGLTAGVVLGAVVSVIVLVIWLPRVVAPGPSDEVTALLDGTDGS